MRLFLSAVLFCFLVYTSVLSAATSNDYLNAGKTSYKQGNLNLAVKYFQAAVQLDPNNWQAHQSLGNCFYQLRRPGEALTAFEKSLALHPDNPSVRTFAESLRREAGAGNGLPNN